MGNTSVTASARDMARPVWHVNCPLPTFRNAASLAVLLLLAYTSSSQVPSSDTASLPIADPKLATTVVARVGPSAITARQFLLAYEFGPAFPKRQKDSKRRFLEYMINEKLLALGAADRGGRAAPEVKRSVSEVVDDLATEELYREDILSKVRVTEGELQDAIAAQRTQYSLRWIYAPTRGGIDQFRDLLSHGLGFDSAFALQLGDSVKPDLRSWETTRFKVRTLRPALAAVADTLKVGIPSAPFEGPDGWYILCLGTVTFDAITSESEEIRQRHDGQRALTQQKADSLSDLYINRLMLDHRPVIEPRTFGILGAYLGQTWLPEERRNSVYRSQSIDRETALAAVANIDRFAKEPLVRMKDRMVTLGRFLSWYRVRDTVLRLRTSSLPAYLSSLQAVVWKMVRDGLLIERATKREMPKRESVRTQKGWWEDKVLYALEKKRLTDSISISDDELRSYYRDHARAYRDSSGKSLSFDQAKENVRKDYYSFEVMKQLLHRIIALKRKYPVELYEDVLRTLPVDTENDPKAIDVYIAKKGGTFPHPAFPTIDYDWQAWQ